MCIFFVCSKIYYNYVSKKRNNEVHLRPRFSIATDENSEKLLHRITNYLNKHHCVYKVK